MATYHAINASIWNDPHFADLSVEEKISVLHAITYREDTEFNRFSGPRFRVADTPRRRPDLYSSEWKALRIEIIAERGTICEYCGEDCSDDPTVDHVVPVCHGVNPFNKSNLVVSCRSCNSRKGGREGWR